MERRSIGQLSVSVIGVGCNNLGSRVDVDGTKAIVEAALDSGINFFDTADKYGNGLSEEVLGTALKPHRSQIVLATKFGLPLAPGAAAGGSPAYIRTAVEASLRRLQTDFIDLYQLHVPDPITPIEDTLGTLGELVTEGKVREIGCSKFSPEELRAAAAAAKPGMARFVSTQGEYSLLQREAEDGLLPDCARLGIKLIPFYPLASGLLTGKYRRGTLPPDSARFGPQGFARSLFTEDNLAKAEALGELAGEMGMTLLQLAFSWLLSHDEVPSAIAGAMSGDQVRSNASAYRGRLSAADMRRVEGVLGTVAASSNT